MRSGGQSFWRSWGSSGRLVRESHAQPIRDGRGRWRSGEGELGVTFIGHSSFLLQMGGKDVLVDPVFATRLVLLRRQRRPGLRLAGSAGGRCGAADACAYGSPESAVAAAGGRGDAEADGAGRRWWWCRRASRTWCRGWASREVRDDGAGGRRAEVDGLHGDDDAVQALGRADVQRHASRVWRVCDRAEGGRARACITRATRLTSAGFGEIGRAAGTRRWRCCRSGPTFRTATGRCIRARRRRCGVSWRLGAELMVPMHFGTFRLGREPMDEPPVRLMAEAARLGSRAGEVLAEGETMRVARRG